MTVVSERFVDEGVGQVRDAFAALLPFAHPSDTLELTGVSFVADADHVFGAVDRAYVARELAWYQSGSLSVYDIPGGPPRIWEQVADPSGHVNSNYGYLLHSAENGDQYENVLGALLRDPDTRQAIAIYTRPSMHGDAVTFGRRDFVCTNTVQYLVRDGALDVVVNMRSNDAVFGYRNDFAWQQMAQRSLRADLDARGLDVDLGTITWQAGSLHVYPRHRHLVELYATEGVHDTPVRRVGSQA